LALVSGGAESGLRKRCVWRCEHKRDQNEQR
jgi:hypothetical protein